jgi:hypothetical protein
MPQNELRFSQCREPGIWPFAISLLTDRLVRNTENGNARAVGINYRHRRRILIFGRLQAVMIGWRNPHTRPDPGRGILAFTTQPTLDSKPKGGEFWSQRFDLSTGLHISGNEK